MTTLGLIIVCGVLALIYAIWAISSVLRSDPGSEKMQEISAAVREGAQAYLRRQYSTIAVVGVIIFLIIGFLLGWLVAVGFAIGAILSGAAGFIGMNVSVRANSRTAQASIGSLAGGLALAFRAGASTGLLVAGLALLSVTVYFTILVGGLHLSPDDRTVTNALVALGFGASLISIFARLGGGIFTKIADVGGDLVGKVEAGIPEDDPRNPATIADNVGDNVGDCAGMAADLFESYEVTLVAAIILAAYAMGEPDFVKLYGAASGAFAMKLVIFALVLRAVGVFSSILGIMAVKVPEGSTMVDPMRPIVNGYVVSALASIVGFFIVNYLFLADPRTGATDWRFATVATFGILLAVATLWLTNYFTHPDKRPTTECATSAKTGVATLILSGLAEGMEASVWAVLVIVLAIIGAMAVFHESLALQFYGIALTGLGLLTTTGFILAMDTYGPITDNAHGIFEMGGVHREDASRTLSWMDAIGNTTKALTKGLAIATAVIAAVSLFRSFIDEAHLGSVGVQINMPTVFVGLLIGGAVPFLFSSFAIKAVSRAAYQVVFEVRRQFREHPGIMEGKELPDYGRCVDIVTATAQKELLGPGILAIFSPLLVAFALGSGALGGFLGGTILTGQLMAVFMSNAGANWDNAKKKIEDGYLGGKGTEVHKATVVGDTVGDPFKDTAGPSLNPMIKVMNLVAILAAPFAPATGEPLTKGRVLVILLSLILLAIAVSLAKRGSIIEEQAGEKVTEKAA